MNKSLWQDILINIPSFGGPKNNSVIIKKSHCEPSTFHIFFLLFICLFSFSMLLILPERYLDYIDEENTGAPLFFPIRDCPILVFVGIFCYMIGFTSITGWTKDFIISIDFYCASLFVYSLGWTIFFVYTSYTSLVGFIFVVFGFLLFLFGLVSWLQHIKYVGDWKHFVDAFNIGSYCIDSVQKEDEEKEEFIRSHFLIIKEYWGVGLFEFKESISESSFDSLIKELQNKFYNQ